LREIHAIGESISYVGLVRFRSLKAFPRSNPADGQTDSAEAVMSHVNRSVDSIAFDRYPKRRRPARAWHIVTSAAHRLFTKDSHMRKIITTTFVTLDGAMQARGRRRIAAARQIMRDWHCL